MKHLLVILGLLLAGAVINVAVPWWCAIYVPLRIQGDSDYSGPGLSSETGFCWSYSRYDSFGYTQLIGGGIRDSARVRENYSTYTYMPVPTWSQFANPPISIYMSMSEEARGWPFRTLSWSKTYYFTTPTRKHVWIIREQPWNSWIIPRTSSNEFYLPLAPIWSGLLLNTFFYAFLLWLLISGSFGIRRIIRYERGLCLRCGYNLKAVDHEACPECGLEVPIQ